MGTETRVISSDFGTLLRHHRLAAGLSQQALAERAQLSIEGVSALERGYRRTPQFETVALLAGALALTTEQRVVFAAAARSGAGRDSGSVTVGPWPNAKSAVLPLSLTSFVGRHAELEEITALLRDHRFVTITGAGGVGKTQTALRTVAAGTEPDERAACFVGLAPVRTSASVASAIASALGVQEVPNRPLLDTLVAYIKDRTLLLILDNCEHVRSEAAAVVETLLRSCANLRILATSREPLRAGGERLYRLPSLPLDDACRLFADRARAVSLRFELGPGNATIVAQICRRLDGIALALELAAARVNVLSIKGIAENLERRMRVLTLGDQTGPPRQQTMRATIEWSYELLSAPEQRTFERLSAFAGGCMLDAAVTVCAGEDVAQREIFNLIASLVDKSLVVADLDRDDARYRLLEPFREYAAERLAERGEERATARRHAQASLTLAERFERDEDDDPPAAWRLGGEEAANWRLALTWALGESNDVTLGQQLVGSLSVLWQHFVPQEGRRWIARALELVDQNTPAEIVAKLNYAQATNALAMGDGALQQSAGLRSLAIYHELEIPLGIARAACRVAMNVPNTELRIALSQEALAIARALDNKRLCGFALRILASCKDDPDEARALNSEAVANAEAAKAWIEVGFATLDRAKIEYRAGDSGAAYRHAMLAVEMFRRFDHARAVAIVLTWATIFLISLERHDEAKRCAHEALDIVLQWQLDATSLPAEILVNLVAIALRGDCANNKLKKAARILGFAEARLVQVGWQGVPNGYEHIASPFREALEKETMTGHFVAGAELTLRAAVDEALAL
jgi:predicted ATPase/transcriptional regulator with XRE-family HTH domain